MNEAEGLISERHVLCISQRELPSEVPQPKSLSSELYTFRGQINRSQPSPMPDQLLGVVPLATANI